MCPTSLLLISYNFSAVRSFALFALGFSAHSTALAICGFPISRSSGVCPQTQTGVCGGQMHPCANRLSVFLTMRSSSEWNVMTASLPPAGALVRLQSAYPPKWSALRLPQCGSLERRVSPDVLLLRVPSSERRDRSPQRAVPSSRSDGPCAPLR